MSKKILMILPALRAGGAERVMITLANGLAERGYDTEIAVLSQDNPLTPWVAPPVRVKIISPAHLITGLPGLIWHIWRRRPETIITSLPKMNLIFLGISFLLPRRIKKIIREVNVPSSYLNGTIRDPIIHLAFRTLYPRAAYIISPSQKIIDEFEHEFHLPHHQQRLLYNPVDSQRLRTLALQEQSVLPGSGLRFVCAGRLHYQKGYDRLLDNLGSLPDDLNWTLTILGEGEERSALEKLIENNSWEGKIFLPGVVDNPWTFIAIADAFLLPSRWEGLPNVVLESLAVGTPVIAHCEAGGIEEITQRANKLASHAVYLAKDMPDFIKAMAAPKPTNPRDLRASLLPPDFEKDNILEKLEQLI